MVVAEQRVEEDGKEKGIMYINADTGELIEFRSYEKYPLAGLTIVLTGGDSDDRWRLKERLEEIGAKVPGSVSRKTAYLVVLSEDNTSKILKAKELNIPIIDYKALLRIVSDRSNGHTEV